ncbi:DUF4229 domain-containing protein [Streptomyces sp. NPDC048057]|uniref:DUF4229 domain-containing protein n=1 Tax=Streptomyces sp. NPDC048057 TaxID=3155628 RepID=UPI0034087800
MSAKSNAALKYTGMRLAVFAGSFAVVAVLVHFGVLPKGLGESNSIWVVLLALVISAPLSFVLLRKQRDAMSDQIVGKVDEAKERLAANRSQEDEAVDAAAAAAARSTAAPQASA